MSDPIPIKPKKTTPPEDAKDIASLWLDPKLGDGLVDVRHHEIPVGKPKDFFRVCPDPAYRKVAEIYTLKVEGQVEEQHFIMDRDMQNMFEETQRCTLVTVIYRNGAPRLWPLKLPKDGGHDNEAWRSAREAAKAAFDKWVKLVWKGRAYLTREAQAGYAPDPDWSKLPAFDELVRLAFGESGIIRSHDHSVVKEHLVGAAAKQAGDDDGLS